MYKPLSFWHLCLPFRVRLLHPTAGPEAEQIIIGRPRAIGAGRHRRRGTSFTLASSDVEKLTLREQQILSLLANGSLYKEISERLGIAHNTVKVHVQHIYEKLHVQSR